MKRGLLAGALSAALLAGLLALAVERGWVLLNRPSREAFPIRGLDVSHHQGFIRWDDVARSGEYRFVWIKATEGGDFVDPRFRENLEGAASVGLYVGAYHYFTLCRPAEDQAAHFLSVATQSAPPRPLPLAIDLEHEGNCRAGRPPNEKIQSEIRAFLREVRSSQGAPPVIYTTREFYAAHLRSLLGDHPLWLRDVFLHPRDLDGHPWQIWQYASRGRVDGIEGFVDLNVFAGDEADFSRFVSGSGSRRPPG